MRQELGVLRHQSLTSMYAPCRDGFENADAIPIPPKPVRDGTGDDRLAHPGVGRGDEQRRDRG
jgi:hypothetical protein